MDTEAADEEIKEAAHTPTVREVDKTLPRSEQAGELAPKHVA